MALGLRNDEGEGTVIELRTALKLKWVKVVVAVMVLGIGGTPVGSYLGMQQVGASADMAEVRKEITNTKKALLIIAEQNKMIAKKLDIEGFPDITIILED